MTENKLKGLDIPELKHKKVYTQEYVDKLEGQLEQAKEILQDVVHQGNREGVERHTIEQAEQFLKE